MMMNKRAAHNRQSQSGNIFFMLFASVALVGAFGVGASNTMKGLVSSMSDVTRKSIAEEKMMGGARLAVQSATALQLNSGDSDSDDMVEPLPFRDAGTDPHPVGGGYLPLDIGATPTDPWGTAYGYCVWDPGTVPFDAGENRLAGYGTIADDYTVVAVISAGKDRQFSTTCNAFVDTTPADGAPDTPLIVRGNGGDDIVLEYTYADANGLSGDDLWRVKDTSPDIAAIDKNIEVTGGAEMSGALALMDKGLVLPADPGDDSITGACTGLNDQELRINAGMSPPVLEICYDNDWVAISMGDGGGDGSCGENWTLQSTSVGSGGAVFANNQFVAVKGWPDYISTSSDGISWTNRTTPAGTGGSWQDLVYANGIFVAVSDGGATRVMTSPDGINWTGRTAAENNSWRGITYGAGLFVAVSSDGANQVMTSPDGINWTPRNVPAVNWEAIAYGNGRFVANTYGSQSMTSFDGINWTHHTSNGAGWGRIIFADGIFITSSDTTMATSTDGVTWTQHVVPDGNWYGMTYVPGRDLFVAAAYNGDERIITSTDGITWTAQTPASTANYNKIVYGNDRLIAFAGDGSVMTSPCTGGDAAAEEAEEEPTAFLPGAVAQYQLDETTGTTITDSKGGASGTLSGATVPSSLVGRSGRAIDFDGTNDRILVGTNASVNALTAMTISGWLRRDAGSGTEIIYTNRNTGSTGIVLQVNATLGRLMFLAGSGGSWTADIGYQMGSWTHFAVTYDASDLNALPTFYANGVAVPMLSGSQPASFTAGAAGASIGSNYAGVASFFNGALDDLRLYGVALPAAHISLLYNDRPTTTSIAPNPSVILAANKYRGKISGGVTQNGCAIKEDGSAWCWGVDNEGQLGNGTPLTQMDVPQRVDTLTAINNFVQVTVGDRFACGLKPDGSVWCWGSDSNGRLGNGPALTASQPNPVQIVGGGVWSQISAGLGHVCGIQTDGSLWCWGLNGHGQLPTPFGDSDTPIIQAEPGPWVYVASGETSTCAIKTDGSLWCWGSNDQGLLGRGGEIPVSYDVRPAGPVAEPGPWVHVARAERSVCAVKLDGSAWCWGRNIEGGLGIGIVGGAYTVPQRVADPGPWLEVAGANKASHHCGIKIDGTAWCWGRNYEGNLGFGSTVEADYPIPMQVADPGPWATIEMSRFGVHGIKTDGSGWSWGLNFQGGLGINQTFTGSTSYPRPIDTSMDVAPFTFNAGQTVLTKSSAANTVSIGTEGRIAYDGFSGGFSHAGSGRSILANPNGNSLLNIRAAGTYDAQLAFDAATGNNDPSMGVDNVTGNFEMVSKSNTTQWMSALTPQIEISSTGMVGVGTGGTPAAKLDIVGGGLKVGNDTRTCTPSRKGVLRYNGTALQYCNGSLWTGF